jgi:hypothetical protein
VSSGGKSWCGELTTPVRSAHCRTQMAFCCCCCSIVGKTLFSALFELQMVFIWASRRVSLSASPAKRPLRLRSRWMATFPKVALCPVLTPQLDTSHGHELPRKHSAATHVRLLRSRDCNSSVTLTANMRCFSTAAMTTRVTCAPHSATAVPAPSPSTSTTPLEHASDLPVSPVLMQELRDRIAQHPAMTWMRVSDLYADLPLRTRREHVRPHKSLLHVLQKVKEELGISLSGTGVLYAVGKMSEPVVQKPQKPPQAEPPAPRQAEKVVTAAPPSHPDPAAVARGQDTLLHPPVDFYYDVMLTEAPLPPADLDISPAQLQRHTSHSSADGSVIAMSDFVAYIPPFFTPLQEVLAHMPGYTEEHIHRFFQSATMELVTVAGKKYIRVHSGYEKLSLEGCEAAEETFQKFRPQPSLAADFEKAFEGVTDKWMSLPELLRRVDPAVVAQLPFQGPAAIMYFAQMQHKFSFAVRQLPPSQVGAEPATEAAVLLRRADYGGLEPDTTPTPKSLSAVFSLVPPEGQVEIVNVERQLPPGVKAEVMGYYGGLSQFFAKHAPIFFVPPETPTVVMRMRYRQRVHVATLSLEEQLEYALKNSKKSKARVIRRRIAFRDNPSHPLLDPENLAKELNNYLPRRGFVSLKVFLKRSVPEEVLMFVPPKIHNFFKGYPQFFTQFEYQRPGSWCLCRPDQPLPRGVIRQSFSEGDLVRIIAEFLQQKGPRSVSGILMNIPRGAHDHLKKRYGGLYFFIIRFPQYFNVVLGSDNSNAQSSGIVHLIQIPGTELDDDANRSTNDPHEPLMLSSSAKGDAEDDDDDYDGLV